MNHGKIGKIKFTIYCSERANQTSTSNREEKQE